MSGIALEHSAMMRRAKMKPPVNHMLHSFFKCFEPLVREKRSELRIIKRTGQQCSLLFSMLSETVGPKDTADLSLHSAMDQLVTLTAPPRQAKARK